MRSPAYIYIARELALYIYQLLLHFLHVCRSRSCGYISRKRRSWYIYTAEEEPTYTHTYKLVVCSRRVQEEELVYI